MPTRLPASLLALVTALLTSLVVAAPAHAAVGDPVTNLVVTDQKQGPGHTWEVTATWTAAPDATVYEATIARNADGSNPVTLWRDTSSTSITLKTDALAAGQQYYVIVRPAVPAPGEGTSAAAGFTAKTLDTAGPSATPKLDRTTGYLILDLEAMFGGSFFRARPGPLEELELLSASFRLSLADVSDDTTAASAIKVEVLPGDGSDKRPWTAGGTTLTYTKAGTYTPHVLLTDKHGNTTDLAVGPIQVLEDAVAPSLRIAKPKKPSKVSSWTRIRGTTTDSGSGVLMTIGLAAQKRGSIWHVYDFDKRKWLPGTTSLKKTVRKTKAMPAIMMPSASGAWRTPKIKHLTRGDLHVEVATADLAMNDSERKLNQRLRR